MKTNNRDCKIVQDLLPIYIENLTDEITNEYIEEHIAKCEECAQALKDMNGEIKLEQINQDKEIKYLKNIRKRVKRTIAFVSLLVIVIASCIVGYVYNESKIQVNNYTFLKISYIVENEKEAKDGNIYGTMIAVFDEKDICVSIRTVERGYKDNYIELYKGIETFPTNLQLINGEFHYNLNMLNRLTKEEVKQNLIRNYKVEEIEEI